MRCSIIRRVSTEEQAKKVSLYEQLSACQKSIAERGWVFVRDFNFTSTHGADLPNHPLYTKLTEHIQANECDVIITYVLDRTLRDTAFWSGLSALLQKHGVLIATPTAVYNPNNLEQELFLNISSAIGHFERKKIRERAIMGLNGLKDAGGWTGGTPPYGYQYDPADKSFPLKLHPEESGRLKEMFRLSLILPKTELCERCNRLGHTSRTGEPWTPRMIRRLLERPRLRFYAGLRLDSHGNEISATWPPLLSRAEYLQLLQKKKSRTTTHNTHPAHLLTGLGIFRCGYCGLSIKTAANRSRKNAKIYYYCSGYARGRNFCKSSRSIDSAKINQIVLKDIICRIQNADAIRAGIAATDTRNQQGREEADLKKRRTDLEAKRDRLILAVEDNLLTYAEITKRLAPIRVEMAELDHRIAEIGQEKAQIVDPEKIFSMEKEIRHLAEYNMQAQREVIALVIEKIILYQKSIIIVYKIPVFSNGRSEVINRIR